MFALVALCNGFTKPLWYKIPDHLKLTIGTLVTVPLRTQKVVALVIKITTKVTVDDALLKTVLAKEALPDDPLYMQFISRIAQLYQIEPFFFIKRLQTFLHDKEEEKHIDIKRTEKLVQLPLLTTEQLAAATFVQTHIKNSTHAVTLLHGITGSGKTEVYKKCIVEALSCNKSVLFLLPEVTLAAEFEERLKIELACAEKVFGFHSGKTKTQKKLLWQKLLNNESVMIVGVHLPVFLPVSNLGLIIIDEEHDFGFQEKNHPRINTKQVALTKAHMYQIPILLGSATPSLRSLYEVKQGRWKFFQLRQRFGANLAKIDIALLKNKEEKRINFWITKKLQDALLECLQKKEQAILFLNRRGLSFFVQCSGCAEVFKCQSCSVSLTLHEDNMLHCHYCSASKILPKLCPQCKTDQNDFLKKGIGTQQMVKIIKELFPQARIARADMDVTRKKKEWATTISAFKKREIDILVGTQTVAKGYHFPKVTVVGLVWADLYLNFPVFNATEHSLQQIIQVAGRAGRTSNNGKVIVQMMENHSISHFFNEQDYLLFFSKELDIRIAVGYPPAVQLIEIEIRNTNEKTIEQESMNYTESLHSAKSNIKGIINVLGPTKPLVHTIKNNHMRIIYIKAATIDAAIHLYKAADKTHYSSSFFFTPIY